MIPLVYGIAVLLFYIAFKALNIVGRTRDLMALFRGAFGVMSDKALTDSEKETLIRTEALRSMGETVKLVACLVGVLVCAAAPIILSDVAGLTTLQSIITFSLNPIVIVITVIGLLIVEEILKQRSG